MHVTMSAEVLAALTDVISVLSVFWGRWLTGYYSRVGEICKAGQ